MYLTISRFVIDDPQVVNSRIRLVVLLVALESGQRRHRQKMANKLSKGEGSCATSHNTSWAYLLRCVLGVEGFGCPPGGEKMTLRSVLVFPPLAMTLLNAMSWLEPFRQMG